MPDKAPTWTGPVKANPSWEGADTWALYELIDGHCGRYLIGRLSEDDARWLEQRINGK